MSVEVDVQRAVQGNELPTNNAIRVWVEAALAGCRTDTELTVRIVDEIESAELNQTYRHKQGPTNVLSFPFESPPEVALALLGDLVVCAPVVAKEAAVQHKAVQAHWAHMIVHGVLHLLGYDHTESWAAREMEQREIEILQRLDFPNPYRVTEES